MDYFDWRGEQGHTWHLDMGVDEADQVIWGVLNFFDADSPHLGTGSRFERRAISGRLVGYRMMESFMSIGNYLWMQLRPAGAWRARLLTVQPSILYGDILGYAAPFRLKDNPGVKSPFLWPRHLLVALRQHLEDLRRASYVNFCAHFIGQLRSLGVECAGGERETQLIRDPYELNYWDFWMLSDLCERVDSPVGGIHDIMEFGEGGGMRGRRGACTLSDGAPRWLFHAPLFDPVYDITQIVNAAPWSLLPPELEFIRDNAQGDAPGTPAGRYGGGRPPYKANRWAYEQVNVLGRPPREVYPQWLELMGDIVETLADPRDSFRKAIRPKRRGKKQE